MPCGAAKGWETWARTRLPGEAAGLRRYFDQKARCSEEAAQNVINSLHVEFLIVQYAVYPQERWKHQVLNN